jgi:GH24 family phage-related lysozyme (muramidase)
MGQIQPVTEPWEPLPECVTLTRYFYTPQERPDALLRAQLQEGEGQVTLAIVRPLQGHQRAALVCLVSDIVAGLAAGPVPFEKSFLVKALNKGMYQIAAAEFYSFCYVCGKVDSRVWQKRKTEAYLFSRGLLLFD